MGEGGSNLQKIEPDLICSRLRSPYGKVTVHALQEEKTRGNEQGQKGLWVWDAFHYQFPLWSQVGKIPECVQL